ncbi:hypothetical protein GCM10012275_61540 [Longimycelium tulufanense]|uniref:Uncharacterized protein n=1 Tax=Longimycelium tulufanense TaxID=907463 RepID=A0A8J3CED7_9PSEU|nr:hypothetical protein [Longimycelium tulufanense]GGM82651.1 hypothetical protein GCM10012275_61540 [Longimycelium tulufanense]
MELLVRVRLAEPDVADPQGPLLDEGGGGCAAAGGAAEGHVERGLSGAGGDHAAGGDGAGWAPGGAARELLGLWEAKRAHDEGLASAAAYQRIQEELVKGHRTVTWADLVRQAVERYEA